MFGAAGHSGARVLWSAGMRIAFSLGGTDLGRSGLGVWAREVLPRLARTAEARGDSVVVLGEPAELAACAGGAGDLPRVRMPPSFGLPPVSALWYLATAGTMARRAGADVLLLSAANRRATLRSPVPVVAVVHDFANFKVQGQSDALRNAYRRLMVLGALRTATEIVAVSAATARDVAELLGPGAPPLRVVPNGVDTARFVPRPEGDPEVAAARARAGLLGPYVLYTARLEHPQKNHPRLIAAFARSRACEGHTLALAGADWGARARVDEAIARSELGARVRWIGFVADADLPLLVAGASAVAMVGLHEGFGLPALEALSAGRPVVASSTGALPEVVGDLAALCDPTDEASIAAALDRALGDAALRDRAARSGPVHAAVRSWEATASGLLSACADAVAGGRGVGSTAARL